MELTKISFNKWMDKLSKDISDKECMPTVHKELL